MKFFAMVWIAAVTLLGFHGQSLGDTWTVATDAKSENGPTISSSRNTVKVAFDGQEVLGRAEVTSDCVKSYGEATYGKCRHKITDHAGRKMTLDSGEEVGFVSLGKKAWLTTLEYACCGSPNRFRVYSDAGKELGYFESFETPRTAMDSLWFPAALDKILLRNDGSADLVLLLAEKEAMVLPLKLRKPLPPDCIWEFAPSRALEPGSKFSMAVTMRICEEDKKQYGYNCKIENNKNVLCEATR